ncbi:UNVERIFIED_CONTAM: hypothetical protein Slati_2877100 [Sesamum latifolium]|uniref:Uncharacterized protein n=1 Tax=Sesamum latifolium TaxID=2727402 RepID=A0AAW2VD33_9LAMI
MGVSLGHRFQFAGDPKVYQTGGKRLSPRWVNLGLQYGLALRCSDLSKRDKTTTQRETKLEDRVQIIFCSLRKRVGLVIERRLPPICRSINRLGVKPMRRHVLVVRKSWGRMA